MAYNFAAPPTAAGLTLGMTCRFPIGDRLGIGKCVSRNCLPPGIDGPFPRVRRGASRNFESARRGRRSNDLTPGMERAFRMRIARFVADDGRVTWGRMIDERSAHPLRGDLFAAHEFLSEAVGVREFLAPLDPPNIFAIGLNYRRHAEEQNAPLPERPLIFIKATTALRAPGRPIVLPTSAPSEVDFEAELAIVIGRRVKNVSEADAFSAVLGYTCANDVSARDCQKKLDKQWARGKSFDTFCPLGPWIVTRDNLDPDRCTIRTRVNGETLQDSNTSDLIFPCRQIISYLSHQFTLLPGTIILTGTPEGVGMFRTPPRYLRAGDKVEVEVGGIGVLSNPVVNDSAD